MSKSTIEELLKQKDALLKKIAEIHPDNSGTTLVKYQLSVDTFKESQASYIKQYKDKQDYLTTNLLVLSASDIALIQKELIELCDILTKLADQLKKAEQDLEDKKSELSTNTQDAVDKLSDEVNALDEKIKDESLAMEKAGEKPPCQTIWINQAMGIFIVLCKVPMIEVAMSGLFSVLKPVVPKEVFDTMITSISNPDIPGFASMISVFIDNLVKAIGNFSIYIFAIKFMVDMVAGLNIGKLLGDALKMIKDVMKEIKQLLSDAPKFIMKKLLSPIFDLNIPIHEFPLDLSIIAPFLPFVLKIPSVDPFNLFTLPTPFKHHPDQKGPIPLDWKKQYFDAAKEKEKEMEDKFKKDQEKAQSDIDKNIDKKKKEIAGTIIPELESNLRALKNQLKILVAQLNTEKRNVKENNTLTQKDLEDANNRMIAICKKIEDLEKTIIIKEKELEDEKIRFANLNVADVNQQINILNNELKNLKENPIPPPKEVAKRAMIINIEQDLGLADLPDRLNNIRLEGADIFSDEQLRALSEVGYNLKDDNYLSIIQKLKTFNISISNIGQLSALAAIGFTVNDSNFETKLSNLKGLGIDVSNSKLLGLFSQLGFNLNSDSLYFNPMSILYRFYEKNIPMTNIDYLNTLILIGWNFNLKDGLNKLLYLSKFADITNTTSLRNLLKRNVNLNNPNVRYLLEEYTKIGVGFTDEGDGLTQDFKEQWVLSNVKVEDIDMIVKILNFYRIGFNNNTYQYKRQLVLFQEEFVSFRSVVSTHFNFSQDAFHYKWNIQPTNQEHLIITSRGVCNTNINNFEGKIIPLGRLFYNNDGIIYYAKSHGINSDPNIISSSFSGATSLGFPALWIGPQHYNYNIMNIWFEYYKTLYPTDSFLQKQGVQLKCCGDFFEEAQAYDLLHINRGYEIPIGYTANYLPVEPWYNTHALPAGYHWQPLVDISLLNFNNFINQWSGDKTLSVLPGYTPSKTSLGITLSLPLNLNSRPIDKLDSFLVDSLDTKSKFEVQLSSLRKFVVDKGWVINGMAVNQKTSEDDIKRIALAYGLTATTSVNPNPGEIGENLLLKSLGSIDRLGLNVRDVEYLNKLSLLRTKIGYNIQSNYYDTSDPNVIKTVMVRSDKYWKWEYNDQGVVIWAGWAYKNETVVEGNANQDDFDNENVKLELKKIILEPDKVEVKDRLDVSLLARFGLNFSQDQRNGSSKYTNCNYMDALDILGAWRLDTTNTSSSYDLASFIRLGFHFNQENIALKIDALNKIGMTFNTDSTRAPFVEGLGEKFDALAAIGFHFTKPDSYEMLNMLSNRGIKLTNIIVYPLPNSEPKQLLVDQFETQLSQLAVFGITFNDKEWKNKFRRFDEFKVNFSSPKWRDQMDNLNMLGLDFTDQNWEKKLDKLYRIKKLGIDPTNIEMRPKIVILTNMGLDFVGKSNETEKQRIEQEKLQFEKEKSDRLKQINDDLLKLNKELSGEYITDMKKQEEKLKGEIKKYQGQLIQNKNEIGKTTDYSILEELNASNIYACRLLYDLEQSLEELQLVNKNYKPRQAKIIKSEITELEKEKIILENKNYSPAISELDILEESWLEKIEELIPIGAIILKNDNTNEKKLYEKERDNKLNKINDELKSLNKELSGEATTDMTNEYNKSQSQKRMYEQLLIQNKEEVRMTADVTKLMEIDNSNKKTCKLLNNLEQQISEQQTTIKNYKPRSKNELTPLIEKLELEKSVLENGKVYKLNRDITVTSVEKLTALADTGFNFNKPSWKSDMKKLLDAGLSLKKANWKDLFKLFAGFLMDAVLAWIKAFIQMLITVISFPLSILMGFVTDLMNFIKALLAVPLSPTKIPKWGKGIIDNFKALIGNIKKLPTPKGIMDLLLKVVDGIIPGFSGFLDVAKNLIGSFPDSIKSLQDFIATQTSAMNKLKQLYNKEKSNLTTKINTLKAMLSGGSTDEILQKEIDKTKTTQKLAVQQLAELEKIAKSATDPQMLQELKDQQEKYCKLLTDIEKDLNDKQKMIDNLKKGNGFGTTVGSNSTNILTPENINKEIKNLQEQLDNLDNKYKSLFDGEKSLQESKDKLKELIDAVKNLSNFCSWNKNIDAVIAILKSFVDGLKIENPYKKQEEFINKEVQKLEDELKTLDEQINAIKTGGNGGLSEIEKKLTNDISDLKNTIKELTDFVCQNQNTLSEKEINDKLVMMQNMKKLLDDTKKSLENVKTAKSSQLSDLEQQRKDLKERYDEFKKLSDQIRDQSDNFELKLNVDLSQFEAALKWFASITNILCNTPKMIVNTIIGIMNKVGKMDNLPKLWEFPLLP